MHHLIDRIYMRLFKRFLDRLASIQTPQGPLIDQGFAAYTNQNAVGWHNFSPIPWIIAGNAGGYLQTGRFMSLPEPGEPQPAAQQPAGRGRGHQARRLPGRRLRRRRAAQGTADRDTRPVRRLAGLVLAGWASTAAAQPGSGSWNAVPLGDLRVGIAGVDITPRAGTPLAGYSGRGGPSTGIHDRLRATAVVFDDGQTRAAIVAVDLLNLREADGQAIAAAIERTAGIPRQHVLLNASHTHAAHSLGKGERGRTELAGKIAGAAARAIRGSRPASLGYGEGTIDFNINRRVIGPDGKAKAGLNPAGIVDRRVKVLRIDHGDGVAPAGVIMNAVCHPNVLRSQNSQISADFVGLARTFVQRSFGGGTLAMYLQGTTGDIRANLPSMDPADGFGRNGSEADLVWAGHGLGGEVVQVAAGLRVREKLLQRKLHLPIRAAANVVEVTPDRGKSPAAASSRCPSARLPSATSCSSRFRANRWWSMAWASRRTWRPWARRPSCSATAPGTLATSRWTTWWTRAATRRRGRSGTAAKAPSAPG